MLVDVDKISVGIILTFGVLWCIIAIIMNCWKKKEPKIPDTMMRGGAFLEMIKESLKEEHNES